MCLDRQVVLIFSLAACSLMIGFLPHLRSFFPYLATQAGLGIVCAAFDLICNAWLIDIWRENANPYLQLMQFFSSLGNLLSPLITAPFLADESSTQEKMNRFQLEVFRHKSQVFIPYLMSAVVLATALIFHIIVYFWGSVSDDKPSSNYDNQIITYNNQDSYDNQVNEKEESSINLSNKLESSSSLSSDIQHQPISRGYNWTVIVLGACLYCFYSSLTDNTKCYMQPFVVNTKLHISTSTSSYMMSAFIGIFSLTRILSVYIATKVSALKMLWFDFVVVMAGNIMLFWFADTWETGIWLGFLVAGVGEASINGSIFAIIEQRVPVTDFVCGVIVFGSCISTAIYPLADGALIETFPEIYTIINMVSIIGCVIFLIAIQFSDLWKSKQKRVGYEVFA